MTDDVDGCCEECGEPDYNCQCDICSECGEWLCICCYRCGGTGLIAGQTLECEDFDEECERCHGTGIDLQYRDD